MRGISSLLRGRKRIVSAIAIAVLAGVPVTLAALHQGFPQTDLHLNARDVWVTNGTELLGGRLNHQIGELDAKVNGASHDLDVLQNGGRTLLTDTSRGTVQVIDPAYVSLTQKISIPVGSQLAYGADSLAILSRQGKLWVLDTSGQLSFDVATTPPDAKLGPGSQVTASTGGTVFALSAAHHRLYTIEHPGAKPTTMDFPKMTSFQLSAVGEVAVALDLKAQTLHTSEGTDIRLDARGLQLQQPGEKNSVALVATGSGLLRVPLSGGDPETVDAGIDNAVTRASAVSAPVYLNGCDYGAWAGAQRYLYACAGKKPVSTDIQQDVRSSTLRFRVNHGVIALNDLGNGNAWLVSAHMQLVNNWSQVNPERVTKDGKKGKERPVKQSFKAAVAHRSTVNRVPKAEDDTFGARPARTTTLPVLMNDTDPDGDILTITATSAVPDRLGTLAVIDGGRSLQFTPATGVTSATISFRYTITDGRKGYDTAQVNVTVTSASVNAAPKQERSSDASVEVGQSIRYNVLGDWLDPDGDEIYLVGASSTTSDVVSASPDGWVTFTSKSGKAGSKQVRVTVSDGTTTATGTLLVTVKPKDSLNPVAVPDYVSVPAGQPVTIAPLDNDLSPSGAPLQLTDAQAESSSPGEFTLDTVRQTIRYESNRAAQVYLTYTLVAGSHTTQGIVLVNVTPPPVTNDPPIAVKDVAYVRPGEPTTVDVLDNDVSPSGRVLVVRSVSKADDADSLNVEVLANSVLRVTAPTVLHSQVQLRYTISDGFHQASAGVTVVPIPPLVSHQAPVAKDDATVVRAGDIASVPVLDNDRSPDNVPFTLDDQLKDASHAGNGAEAFVSGDLVRYQAPTKPGTYRVSYGISDKFSQHDTASVTFTVTPANGAHNHAPEPRTLTGRAFAGSSVRIDIPLSGIDPDGDSVSLVGVDTSPALGRITGMSSSSVTYDAYPSSVGTDQFTYTVEDTFGKKATATVRIGVIPRPSTTKPPVAVDDHVQVKPGKVASVPVLLNDSDPNGYLISLEPKLPEVQAPLKAKVSGGKVMVTAPKKEGAYVVRYQITNGHGGSATAFIQVMVRSDAEPEPPVAKDHIVTAEELTGKKHFAVDVYDGARNPSGLVSDLTVAVQGPNAKAAKVGDGGKVTVTPTDHRIAITYALTDPTTSLVGKAFIIVPPKPGATPTQERASDRKKHHKKTTPPPHLKASLPAQVVEMNGTKTWSLSDIIDVPSGRPAHLTSASGVHATHTDGTSAYRDAHSLIFAAEKDYRGAAAITFKVDDGRDPGMDHDRITMLTLPLTVGKSDKTDVPPTFTPPSVKIEAGEKAQTIDLRDSSYHPNPAVLKSLTYSDLQGATHDVQATLSGSKLTVSAPFGVQPGTDAKLTFTVHDGKTFTIPGSVTVHVVSSTRPVAVQKNAPQKRDVKRGTTGGITVNNAVGTADWVNPFPDHPLRILDAKAVSAPKGITVTSTADSVTVIAGTAAKPGDVNVTYRVQDATKDPDRVQTGRLTVTIHDVPAAPPKPTNVVASDGSASMTISAPATDNGRPVTGYTISWKGGSTGSKTVKAKGKHTITGLKNGKAYRFRVLATNADGDSNLSAWSASVTPWGQPSAPRNLTISAGTYAKTTLSMKWKAPNNKGGGDLSYSYKVNSGKWSAWSTSRTASKSVGKGTYRFTVRVRNGGGKVGPKATSRSVTVKVKPPPPPPDPSVTLTKGARTGYMSNCHSGNCFFYHITVKHFDPGAYDIDLYCNGSHDRHWVHGMSVGANGTGVADTGNDQYKTYCGYSTAHVKVGNVVSPTISMLP